MTRSLLCNRHRSVVLLSSVLFLLMAVAAANARPGVCNYCITLTLCKTYPTCASNSDGTITATFSGGTAPYQIRIDNGAFVPATSPYTFTGVGVGLHPITVMDVNGCTQTVSVTLSAPTCGGTACWLTGGGSKKSPIVDGGLGESEKPRKLYNWGGNVNPGCSPDAGDGGSWNLIDVAQSLHFHATHIQVIDCGNIDNYPPGSTSPATPFNFIEFTGYGWLAGVKGNKTDMGLVYFWARAEDRNEPGSNGTDDGNAKDRLFVNVYTDQFNPNGTSIILLDIDGNPATVDPFTISTGNLQIHISSCDVPPANAFKAPAEGEGMNGVGAPVGYALGANYPNPFNPTTSISFSVAEPSHVYLGIFNMLGQEVATLVNGEVNSGATTVEWNASDSRNTPLPSGMYIYRMQAHSLTTGKDFQSVKRMLLMK